MEELKTLVGELEGLTEKNKIIDQLQIIGEYILQHCYFQFGEIKIFPLWIEAYYYKEGVFEDPFNHCDEGQKDHFKEKYSHKIGRGGIDVCLSKEKNYYLSYLIKVSKSEDGKYYKQTDLKSFENANFKLIEQDSNDENVISCYRIGLNCFGNKSLCYYRFQPLAFYIESSIHERNNGKKIYNDFSIPRIVLYHLKYLKYVKGEDIDWKEKATEMLEYNYGDTVEQDMKECFSCLEGCDK